MVGTLNGSHADEDAECHKLHNLLLYYHIHRVDQFFRCVAVPDVKNEECLDIPVVAFMHLGGSPGAYLNDARDLEHRIRVEYDIFSLLACWRDVEELSNCDRH